MEGAGAGELEVNVRPAEKKDCAAIVGLIKELAEFEKMPEQVLLTVEDFERDGFGPGAPSYSCLIAEIQNQLKSDLSTVTQNVTSSSTSVIGYALYFPTYSTWTGKCLYLEDLYVQPAYRHQRVGTKLLQRLAKVAMDGGYVRLGLQCLGWNKSGLEYYKRLEGRDLTVEEDWHAVRFTRDALAKIAEGEAETGIEDSCK